MVMLLLQSVGGLVITGVTNLNSLRGLSKLTGIGGDMVIYKNHQLESFAGLGPVTEIYNRLIVANNRMLVNMTGLEVCGGLKGVIAIVAICMMIWL